MLTANMLLIVSFFSGQFSGAFSCPKWSNLFLTAPQKMEALEGSCLQIPCHFWARHKNNFDDSKTFGVWIKSDPERDADQNTVVFHSSGSINTYPMKIIGNLNQRDCTTLFSNIHTKHTGQYLFRVEKWPFMETALCDHLQLTVKYSPPSPRIEISGDLTEGESVTITCSALTPCPRLPPKLTWNLQKDSHNHMEKNTDGSFTTKIQKSIALSDQHDGNIITCSASYPVNEGKEKTAEETKTLRVSPAPKDTSVSVTKVNLTCSSRARPPVSSFTWFKISNNRQVINVSEGEFYSFNVTDGGIYYCVSTNDLNTQISPETPLSKDDPDLRVIIHITVKILGIVILYGTFLVFECWFGLRRCCSKPVNERVKYTVGLEEVDRVEISASRRRGR